ncbi:hypothetical protein [Streptomyces nymphaeiformis]|jgi:hypothetical protein|uniref:Lipoprotein n=1 Tax=Streptomyces nymphaeiformis TaxID=2663842 RepID=A0A7W7TTS3_9ACTN|nr:hypothetical protein [Streptomyces nymphaeiformis]MBB4979179.1 hypothetical protein [Streptomyces nymphaeiformis]
MRRASASVSTALALGLLLAACGNGEEQPQVSAVQQCEDALSPTASRALESLLGTGEFNSDGTAGLDAAVGKLIEDQAFEGPGRALGYTKACSAKSAAIPRSRIRITFDLYEDASLFDDGTPWSKSGRHLYAMGREASTDNKKAHFFVGCSSPRLKGSEGRPAPIQGWLEFDKPVEGAYPPNTPATREAYLTVLHSVTLAVVKKLGCQDNAGLPEVPVFTEKKWRGEQ